MIFIINHNKSICNDNNHYYNLNTKVWMKFKKLKIN
jgi:hypothetical protein